MSTSKWETATAAISTDGLYRYQLTRTWDQTLERLPFVMLNPSTADAEIDDPTITRCIGFGRDLGYGGITVVNLYAYRATKPTDLWLADDPVGPENDEYLAAVFSHAVDTATPVIAAWGVNPKPMRVYRVLNLPYARQALHHLGTTKDGSPRHPLYLPAAATPEPWGVR